MNLDWRYSSKDKVMDEDRCEMAEHREPTVPSVARGHVYIFFREGTFYPIELRDDNDARANAECNPGTIRVQDIQGKVIWQRHE